MKARRQASEDDVVAWIRRLRKPRGRSALRLELGIGDDAAVIATRRGRMVVTSDMMVEGVDFERASCPLPLVGWKALAASISDVAAMGAWPALAFASLAVPGRDPATQCKAVLGGLMKHARRHGIVLAGGDLSRSGSGLVIDVTLLGVLPEGRRPALRSGARPGDLVAVSGTLGLAALGLERLRAGVRLHGARGAARKLVLAQLRPSPEPALGPRFGSIATAMIDVSDGLAIDLGRLCRESGVGAVIDEGRLPLAGPSAGTRAARVEAALHGGEDYVLCFTVPPRRAGGAYPATIVGRITKRRGLVLATRDGAVPVAARGFSHF
ncbi:MAG: thiamine-phosphate kinase [Acidobacteriota bacterium]